MSEDEIGVSFDGILPRTKSEFALLAANLAALGFSVRGGWGVAHMLWLYTGETLVIGLINILKILLSGKNEEIVAVTGQRPMIRSSIWKSFLAAFFSFAFGTFFMIQTMFLYSAMFGPIHYTLSPEAKAVFSDIALPVILLALSHLVSFFLNYLPRERLNVSAQECMHLPIPRLLYTYPAMGVGALAMKYMGGGAASLVIFVVLKVSFDLKSHKRERKMQGGAPVEGDSGRI